MGMLAGFAEVEITPPVGTEKIGWLKVLVGQRVADPLFGRVCVLSSGKDGVAFVTLDLLSIGRRTVAEVRRRVEEKFQFPGANIMVSATHNHAGPAIVRAGEVKADERYGAWLVERLVDAFGKALNAQEQVMVGFGHARHFTLGYNRRVVVRDGTVRTHGHFDQEDALFMEGPVDPELFVISVKENDTGNVLGCIANYACHPTDHGGDDVFSAGWPGVFAAEMKRRGGMRYPMFANGAQGNVSLPDPMRGGKSLSMEDQGNSLAGAVSKLLPTIKYADDLRLAVRSEVVHLPFREPNEEQVKGTIRGAQRFVDPKIYDRLMPELLQEVRTQGRQPAEVQVFELGDRSIVAIPAELFTELGLRVKERCHPKRAVVFGLSNAMVGYVPHKDAFARGGYETTFLNTSKLAPEAGDLLVDAAVRLVTQRA